MDKLTSHVLSSFVRRSRRRRLTGLDRACCVSSALSPGRFLYMEAFQMDPQDWLKQNLHQLEWYCRETFAKDPTRERAKQVKKDIDFVMTILMSDTPERLSLDLIQQSLAILRRVERTLRKKFPEVGGFCQIILLHRKDIYKRYRSLFLPIEMRQQRFRP